MPIHRTPERPSDLTGWTLEERLHRLRNRFLLLRDISLQRVFGMERADGDGTADGAEQGLADICDEAAVEIRGLLNALPIETLNWSERDRGTAPATRRIKRT